MGVARKLEADARSFDDGQPAGDVVQENAGLDRVKLESFKNGSQANWAGGVAIRHSQNLKVIDDHFFVAQDAYSGASKRSGIVRGAAILFVISGGEIDAEGRR